MLMAYQVKTKTVTNIILLTVGWPHTSDTCAAPANSRSDQKPGRSTRQSAGVAVFEPSRTNHRFIDYSGI